MYRPIILQEYFNEFCYRFNRRRGESELPLRLLDACLTHTQVKLKTVIRNQEREDEQYGQMKLGM